MSHVQHSAINQTRYLTRSEATSLPQWAEVLRRVQSHIPLDSKPLSVFALKSVLNHLVDSIDRSAYCLAVVGSEQLDPALVGSAHLRETLYVKQEGEDFNEKNAYSIYAEFAALGMQVPEARTRFYHALGRLQTEPLTSFNEPGRSAYIVTLGGLSFGVVCPGDGFGARRIVVHRKYCGAFLSICRELSCLEVLFDQSLEDLDDIVCCTDESESEDAYQGIAAEVDKRFSPELIEHDVPAHAMSGFKMLAKRFDSNPNAWETLTHGERMHINRDRFRYLILPQMFQRYGLEEGAEADIMRIIGLADRVLGDDMADLGGVSAVLDQMEAYITAYGIHNVELQNARQARLSIIEEFRRALRSGFREQQDDKAHRSSLHHFLMRLARRACQDPGFGNSC